MNANTPYAGLPGVTRAGRRAAADVPEFTPEQRRALRRDVSQIAARTREFLPDEYVVDAEITLGIAGPEATVAVHPPAGHAVSAGFVPDADDADDLEDGCIDPTERDEVAQGLAASAALQVKLATEDGFVPAAR